MVTAKRPLAIQHAMTHAQLMHPIYPIVYFTRPEPE